jgi:signal transduction histidine kinase
MPQDLFEDMKRYMGFTEADARLLADLRQPLQAALPAVVDRFYDAIHRHPQARAVLAENHAQFHRLRRTLRVWLDGLFSGQYDDAYFEACCNIGRTHVRVNLPQHYMFTSMNIVRNALEEAIRALRPPARPGSLAALHKILDLELGVMNQTYREALVLRVQQMEHAEYEQRISESQHLATIGQLAASLAHEIKNPLAGISGAIQVLGADLDDTHPHKEIISEALRQIDRLDAAVRDLLIYARPKAPVRSPTSLAKIIGQALTLLREEPSFRRVQVHCHGLNLAHVVPMDESQMLQVITNLLLNAAHACERGGDIHCRLRNHDSVALVEIEDTGTGIPPDVLEKVFEPFYTTKARGTGLGLSICKRIIEAHGGRLDIQSQPGQGTRVTFSIPERP